MAQLRKTLGSATDPGMLALQRQMVTQSATTLARWSVGYAAGHYLPIYERLARQAGIQDADALESTLMVVDGYLEGHMSAAQAKKAIAASRTIARGTLFSPTAQAAARACSTAASVAFSPTSALGMCGYGAAAAAYDAAGTDQPRATYDQLAQEEFARQLESLQEDSVPDEPNPIQVDWNC